MTFGEKCRKFRTQRKLTQEQVATAVGISKRTYTYYESGEKYPRRVETIQKLADFFAVDRNRLLVEDDEYLVKEFETLPSAEKFEKLTAVIRHLLQDETIPSEQKMQFCQTIAALCPPSPSEDTSDSADNTSSVLV